ncbi:uncharacterized protein LOC111241825 isoform X2 [Vigna radiata var. radiata]|uniref:Uncharacterized protein LOC111241825 isoform X2 n=1 Tax=Vigna radiata var. radiata TaxID=3916 RepID=A0A3Q0F0M0_VIGRR|nr:uncharacterized protein LOC111241825 isoform X2 [Vigna radiata var. radiata]
MKRDNFYGRESSKEEKENKEKDKEKEEDMFTKLPEQIIVHILSFLDAKIAVQTSVLNKRFRDTSTNVFNFNLKCRKDHAPIHRDNHVVYYIIYHVIDTPSITTNIEVLTILAECALSKLPKLSVCTSLTTLKLTYILTLTKNFDIPSLKHLYLCCCRFVVGRVNSFDPFKGCVNLESLHIDRCTYHDEINTFKISTPNLLDLNISHFLVDGEFGENDCVFELQTPRLRYFKYDGYRLYCFSTEINLLFVEELYIDVGLLPKDIYSLYTLIELFEIMQRAKSISLSSKIIEVLSMFPDELEDKCSPFTRMETFELIGDTSSSFAMPQDVKNYLFGEDNSSFTPQTEFEQFVFDYFKRASNRIMRVENSVLKVEKKVDELIQNYINSAYLKE